MNKFANVAIFFGILLSIFLYSFFGVPVLARSYIIEDYHTDVKINEDGSCDFTDRFIYNFDGRFNGIYFDIDYAGCGDFKDYSVSLIDGEQEKALCESRSEMSGTYELSLENKVARFKIYSPADSESKTFLFRYKLTAPVDKFADIAQFNRKLIPNNFGTQIRNFNGEISFQHEAKTDDLRIFAHGPLYGESKINDNGTVSLMISNLAERTFVEANLLFPTDYVPNMKFTSQEKELDKILAEEKEFAGESNNIRDEIRNDSRNKVILAKVALCWYIFSFAIFIVLAIILSAKKRREYYTEHFDGDYYRELPANYTPAEMSILVNGKISDRDMTATLLDLFRKKIITIESVEKGWGNLFKKHDCKITKMENFECDDSIVEHEKFLLDFLINEIGDSESVYMSEIKNFAKRYYQKFESGYDHWKELLYKAADEHAFFVSKLRLIGNFTGCGLFAFSILLGVLISILRSNRAYEFIVLLVLLFATCLIILFAFLKSPLCNVKREKSKQVEYEKWLAFKKFLKDFSCLSSAPVGSIVIWEHYLVYAVSLGIAKQVIKQLPLVFKDYDFKSNKKLILLSYVYSGGNISGSDFEYFASHIHDAYSTAVRTKAIAKSKNSSMIGQGGGFSRGSSGGSGGKGGGGAF